MKKLLYSILIVFVLLLGCSKPVLLPNLGTVKGQVYNIHNELIEGVEVKITHIPASESDTPSASTVSTQTDYNGTFEFHEVWDDYQIDVKKTGFQGQSFRGEITSNEPHPIVDFKLVGSPENIDIHLSRDTLNPTDSIDLIVHVEIEDAYNEITAGYTGDLMFSNSEGVLLTVLPLSPKAESIGESTLEVLLSPESLAFGRYEVSALVKDPDGNQIVTERVVILNVEE